MQVKYDLDDEMNKNNICNNCNKIGHLFHNCKLPITSYGVILIRMKNKRIEYLMIRRKEVFFNFYLKPKLENADMENR